MHDCLIFSSCLLTTLVAIVKAFVTLLFLQNLCIFHIIGFRLGYVCLVFGVGYFICDYVRSSSLSWSLLSVLMVSNVVLERKLQSLESEKAFTWCQWYAWWTNTDTITGAYSLRKTIGSLDRFRYYYIGQYYKVEILADSITKRSENI